jgi:hypothetical protein
MEVRRTMEQGIRFHPHARERMNERGATETEIVETILHGERFSAKFGRCGFRRNFTDSFEWRGHTYDTKQIETYAVQDGDIWLVLTVLVKYF